MCHLKKMDGATYFRQRPDPLFVFNVSIFNFDDGWNRIFNQFKIHENATYQDSATRGIRQRQSDFKGSL